MKIITDCTEKEAIAIVDAINAALGVNARYFVGGYTYDNEGNPLYRDIHCEKLLPQELSIVMICVAIAKDALINYGSRNEVQAQS